MSGGRGLFIANPSAGRGRTRRLAPLLADRLTARGLDLELRLTAGSAAAADAARAAAAAGCERVIVAGGDGTVNSVVGALIHTPTALGVIPTGMVNAFARELGIPRAWRRACDLAAGDRRRTIDVARVARSLGNRRPDPQGREAGDGYFALMLGVGLDAQTVAAVDPRLKRLVGPAAYVLAGLRCVLARARPAQMRLRFDDGEVRMRALMAVVANGAHYTYEWRVAPQARIDDGLLDVVVFGWRRPLDPVRHVLRALGARPPQPGTLSHTGGGARAPRARQPEVITMRTRRLHIECTPQLPVHLDGDAAGRTPVEVEILPRALSVLAGGESGKETQEG